VNALLALPLEVRLAGVFVLGLAVGGAVNWAIYSLAWFARPVSPWSPPHEDALPRHWSDRLPVIGWLGLSREAKQHGSLFWLRPALIELGLAAGVTALYYWEVERLGLLMLPLPPGVPLPTSATLHWQFAAHALLIALMTAATFIDFDEQTIPDEITVTGTVLALCLAILVPQSHLPVLAALPPAAGTVVGQLSCASPHEFPSWLHGWEGLALACAGFTGWCLALIPATCTLRRGTWKAIQYYFVSIARGSAWKRLLGMALFQCLIMAIVWRSGGPRWESLFTAVIGLAFGGALIWAVRIVGTLALREEAMGFGDVTLMAMIGAFLGWQPALITFFFSPVAALFVALTQWLVTGRRDIAFGPYLCVAAVYVLVRWGPIWDYAEGIFRMGWLLLGIFAACLLLMMGLLMLMRIVRQLLT
jgi:prepilin signal peptidase PulO-like enzyme (type II secretory pathway)